MINVTVYRKADCAACDQVLADLQELQAQIPHKVILIELEKTPEIRGLYLDKVPIIEVGPYRLSTQVSKQDLQVALGAAQDRNQHLERVGDSAYLQRVQRGQTITGTDRFTYWLSNHYTLLINLIVFIYVGLPFLAPILMKVNAEGPAKFLYTIYSPLCHQFAFRSFFLFGEQAAYPRALAGVPGLITYEQATGLNALDVLQARAFLGNDQLGYKVAICERDVAIYAAILLFGMIYAGSGRRVKSLPWYIWLAVGILPIAIDGFTQLPSLMTIPASLSWLPIRESTLFERTASGFLFGFLTAWYGYPYIEESMIETRQLLTRKIAVVTSRRLSASSDEIK